MAVPEVKAEVVGPNLLMSVDIECDVIPAMFDTGAQSTCTIIS